MRQLTSGFFVSLELFFSKLPMRQLTWDIRGVKGTIISKLPMRQLTRTKITLQTQLISKLPMRQLTDAGAEKEADSTCAYTSFSHFDPNLFLP